MYVIKITIAEEKQFLQVKVENHEVVYTFDYYRYIQGYDVSWKTVSTNLNYYYVFCFQFIYHRLIFFQRIPQIWISRPILRYQLFFHISIHHIFAKVLFRYYFSNVCCT